MAMGIIALQELLLGGQFREVVVVVVVVDTREVRDGRILARGAIDEHMSREESRVTGKGHVLCDYDATDGTCKMEVLSRSCGLLVYHLKMFMSCLSFRMEWFNAAF